MSAYTRILAKKYPSFRVNCLCPGYCKTDITTNTGILTAAEGAENATIFPNPVILSRSTCALKKEVLLIPHHLWKNQQRGMHAVVTGANKGLDFMIRSQYGRLDILFDELPDGRVNNAAISGTTIDSDALAASKITGTEKPRAGQLYWFVKTDMMISNETGTSSVDEIGAAS
ncbi:hypothetical protein OIU84_012696 [Salix udensis]|uniref:Uncharacterized protein n=1 Tax=Salix udensis TaxID=889485 RepID=A0AAD6NT63_9ROSI|nr:hypothetical protein OIU84_012696 [Salix udensis]